MVIVKGYLNITNNDYLNMDTLKITIQKYNKY